MGSLNYFGTKLKFIYGHPATRVGNGEAYSYLSDLSGAERKPLLPGHIVVEFKLLKLINYIVN